jgi:hypothetical protein
LNRKRATVTVLREGFQQSPQLAAPTPPIVLREVFELLEEYGPVWYTEEIHDRIRAALSNDRPN